MIFRRDPQDLTAGSTGMMPSAKTVDDPNYVPSGPYILFRYGCHGIIIPDLAGAIEAFVRYGIPPIRDSACSILDRDGVIVIGWIGEDPIRWSGLRVGAENLRSHPLVEPLLMVDVDEAIR